MTHQDFTHLSNAATAIPFSHGWPRWVPRDVAHYLHHVELGLSLRELARLSGCHPSTILRQVRRLENRRDDPLVDAALRELGRAVPKKAPAHKDCHIMKPATAPMTPPDDDVFEREAGRVLESLSEPGALLAVVPDMEKAVVVREGADGTTRRIAVVDTEIAQAMALKNWIACQSEGRIARYGMSALGRSELPRLLDKLHGAQRRTRPVAGLSDAQTAFDPAPVKDAAGGGARRVRYSAAETPLSALSRRRDKNGQPFLSSDLVAAGERLREDFELSQMSDGVTQNWDRMLTGRLDGGAPGGRTGFGPSAARDRVARALGELGPGLGDMALRCCCYLEGLESAERRMGWSARSGKIVLRIALQRLARFYNEDADGAAMIG